MVTLEQIKLLESKITRAVNFVSHLTEENGLLKRRNEELEKAAAALREETARAEGLNRRNEELERTVAALREETTKVEEGIVSALGKLNQFEDAIERSLSAVKTPMPAEPYAKPAEPIQPAPSADSPLPSAYMVDEETETAENSDEAELDIF
ncbi:MAG: cell division protein ZapB [Treponema sp.]|nr:cell division protein ZapB [Treponema sp.]